MAISWNEIVNRAITFSKEWENETSEDAEAKSFLDGFFNVFGIHRRRVGRFESRVKKIGNKDGYIDFLWKGMILIEQKSKGQDLVKAYKQAQDYFPGLDDAELPKYILVSDFEHFRLFDLDTDSQYDFELKDLYKNVKLFSEIAGYIKTDVKPQDPVNSTAALRMGKLHDKLKAVGYEGRNLEIYLVRVLFCLFAEDTTIFEKNAFHDYIKVRTNHDGSDLAAHITQLFQVLNTPEDTRLKNIDEMLNGFPYVNGRLFEDVLPVASFDSEMRQILLECARLDWSKISPAIFGSMFQSVMNDKERRNLGAHYTSEENILKLIKPLFLDELTSEFNKVKKDKRRLTEFHKKLSSLRFFDPACGCGNFLVITYRELRLLEIEVLRQLQDGQQVTHIDQLMRIDVDQFYGIEIDEWPAQIAQVAMYLIDHQMNMKVSVEFGDYFRRLPLKKAPNIVQGNALRIDWTEIFPFSPNGYILGNPPFIGMQLQSTEQKKDVEFVFNGMDGCGVLDYVACWYVKAATYMQNVHCRAAFVSTNSIQQGEQIGILWTGLFNRYKVKITFAHSTFQWRNEAKGNAAVYVVIIGFTTGEFAPNKRLFTYDTPKSLPHEERVANINPYLIPGNDLVVMSRSKPIVTNAPKMSRGNSPYDNGHLLFTDEEKRDFIKEEPRAKKYIKELISSKEYLSGKKRWCLWLVGADPTELRAIAAIQERIKLVLNFRKNSKGAETRKYAVTPAQFRDLNNPESFILIPRHSSESRRYIPMGFFTSKHIPSDSCMIIPNGKLYHFGILMSQMHMAWVKTVCGRIKSDYRYSKDIVYNNFPWPEQLSSKQVEAIENAAQTVLNVRAEFVNSSPADLYDPVNMPSKLMKAHQQLDKAVDLSYRSQLFVSELNRTEFLFGLYEKYTAGLFAVEKKTKRSKKVSS